jgi:hypothetical protein
MAKKTIVPEYVTREILKKELSASEQRLEVKIAGVDKKIDGVGKRLDAKIDSRFSQLDAKIDTTAQSLKEYTDSRFNRLDTKIDGVEKRLDSKMSKYFELMMQALTDGNKGIHQILSNHEGRITVLEGRGPQASKI